MLGNSNEKKSLVFILILLIAIITTGCKLPSGDFGQIEEEKNPFILSVLPENGAIAVPLDTTISIVFSKSMEQGSVEQAISLNPGNLELVFIWSGNGKQLELRPAEIFNHGSTAEYYDRATVYILNILPTAKNIFGKKLNKNYSTSFTTQTYPQIVAGKNYTMCLSYDGSIWGWGCNSSGNLGDGTQEDTMVPVSPVLNRKVKEINTGNCGFFSSALMSDGSVYIWGKNDDHELGLGHDTDFYTPQLLNGIDTLGNVIKISSGTMHTIVLNQDDEIISWGDNTYSQVGISKEEITGGGDQPVPIKAQSLNETLSSIIKIKSGVYFSGALTSEGKLYMWGGNYKGQLGVDTDGDDFEECYHIPQEITGLGKVIDFDCGNLHVLAIAEQDGINKLYSWGYNEHGQLGRAIAEDFTWIPGEVTEIDGTVIKVKAAIDSSFAITESGDLYAWGKTDYYKLGIVNLDIDNIKKIEDPTWVLDNVMDIATGINHTIVMRTDGSLWSWGLNEDFQLGRETEDTYNGRHVGKIPEKVPDMDLNS